MKRLRIQRPGPRRPGSKGGKGYYDGLGIWHYGDRPVKTRANVDHFSTARERERHTGVRHHVIEYTDKGGNDKRYFHTHHADTHDHVGDVAKKGGTVHNIYTARGRKLTEGERAKMTSRREREIRALTEEGQRRANKEGHTFVIVSTTPKGDIQPHYSLLSDSLAEEKMHEARASGATVSEVKKVQPHAAEQPSPVAKPQTGQTSRKKDATKEDVAAPQHKELTDESEGHRVNKSEEVALSPEEVLPTEEVSPVRGDDEFWLQPLEGDKFASVPKPGFSYRWIGTVVKSFGPNGLYEIAYEEERGPGRKRDIVHLESLRRDLDRDLIRSYELVQPVLAPEPDWPTCHHCLAKNPTSKPETGYCDGCLMLHSHWWG